MESHYVQGAPVCQRCRSSKKKCNKTLPSCGRCTRLNVPCLYPGSEPVLIKAPPPVSEYYFAAFGTPSSTDSEMTTSSLLPRHVSTPLGCNSNLGSSDLDLDSQVGKQVLDVVSRSGYTIDYICSRYTRSVHQWFSVIDDPDTLTRCFDENANPSAETWMLLMSLTLVARMYGQSESSDRSEIDSVYLATKSLFAFVSSFRQPTDENIQTGLLIALYEHCQALYEAAYMSIGTCTRMGYLLGYDKTLARGPSNDRTVDIAVHKKRRVWWCIFIIERLLKLEHLQSNAPLAIPTPSLMDLLPSNIGTLHPVVVGLSFTDTLHINLPTFPDDNGKLTHNVFSSIAQACYLLGRSIDEVSTPRDPQQSGWKIRTARLDQTIQTYAMALLRTGNERLHCWPYDICMSALLILNRYEVQQETISNTPSRAASALKSVTRMAVDSLINSSQVLAQFSEEVPIWGVQTAFLAAAVEAEYGGLWEGGRHEEMMCALERVRIVFGGRWRLAGTLYKAIEDTNALAMLA